MSNEGTASGQLHSPALRSGTVDPLLMELTPLEGRFQDGCCARLGGLGCVGEWEDSLELTFTVFYVQGVGGQH